MTLGKFAPKFLSSWNFGVQSRVHKTQFRCTRYHLFLEDSGFDSWARVTVLLLLQTSERAQQGRVLLGPRELLCCHLISHDHAAIDFRSI
jgi:hypothetical protein